MDNNPNFQSGQILYLECECSRLYTELIQVVVSRQLCWVRPLLLVNLTQEIPLVNDLRDANDILWSINSFYAALDTDAIEFLSQVIIKQPKPELEGIAKQQLNQFIQKLWQSSQAKLT
ncbi:MAG: hypothetical protein HC903_01810 [Methylacidiphilales bacterium]|nr:hypothetical protein [Candidatus Methylacidiphilales bacterium]NJR16151.1 hypothetical protein [Calothrix sp. CSU_2_0]